MFWKKGTRLLKKDVILVLNLISTGMVKLSTLKLKKQFLRTACVLTLHDLEV